MCIHICIYINICIHMHNNLLICTKRSENGNYWLVSAVFLLLFLFEKWKWKMLPSVRSPCWCPVEPCRRCLVQASCIIQIWKQTWKQRKWMRRHLIQTLIQAKFWNFAKMKRWHIYLFLSRLLWSLSRMPSGMPPMMFTTSSSFTGISRQLLVEKDDNQIAISIELSWIYRTIVRR